MSTAYLLWLVATVLTIVSARLVLTVLPLPGLAVRLKTRDAALIGVGALGLAFHCGAMFFRSSVQSVFGPNAAIRSIDALGSESILWFVTASALLFVGLRRIPLGGLVVAMVCLTAVGVTMYDGGALTAHLAAIFVCVTVLAALPAGLVRPPWTSTRV